MSEQATIDIAIEQPVLAREGARAFDSYLAHPRSGKGPGLVIFTEMRGRGCALSFPIVIASSSARFPSLVSASSSA